MSFDNAVFWDERYRTNLALGSGAGSRGKFLTAKRDLVRDVIARLRPRSILDVGCGDIEVTRGLAFEGVYTGIDLSPFIVERNREVRPDWTFVQGDFLALAQARALQADLVLCLDVLIHQHDHVTYRELMQALLGASQVALVVNGFDTQAYSSKLSPNVAFHEPIMQTLRNCGAVRTELLATFRRTAFVLVDTKSDDLLTPARLRGG
jgi:trans-aconitate methyltransferase